MVERLNATTANSTEALETAQASLAMSGEMLGASMDERTAELTGRLEAGANSAVAQLHAATSATTEAVETAQASLAMSGEMLGASMDERIGDVTNRLEAGANAIVGQLQAATSTAAEAVDTAQASFAMSNEMLTATMDERAADLSERIAAGTRVLDETLTGSLTSVEERLKSTASSFALSANVLNDDIQKSVGAIETSVLSASTNIGSAVELGLDDLNAKLDVQVAGVLTKIDERSDTMASHAARLEQSLSDGAENYGGQIDGRVNEVLASFGQKATSIGETVERIDTALGERAERLNSQLLDRTREIADTFKAGQTFLTEDLSRQVEETGARLEERTFGLTMAFASKMDEVDATLVVTVRSRRQRSERPCR